MTKSCDNCNEFAKINKNRCYGACTKFNFVFALWESDSRNHVCDEWTMKDEKTCCKIESEEILIDE